jgi:hypothetical protein
VKQQGRKAHLSCLFDIGSMWHKRNIQAKLNANLQRVPIISPVHLPSQPLFWLMVPKDFRWQFLPVSFLCSEPAYLSGDHGINETFRICQVFPPDKTVDSIIDLMQHQHGIWRCRSLHPYGRRLFLIDMSTSRGFMRPLALTTMTHRNNYMELPPC